MEPSYVNIENLVFGRMAFRGMNPEIERMMEAERTRAEEAAAAAAEKDVDDQEMAEVALNNTVARKFAPKRTRDGGNLVTAAQQQPAVQDPSAIAQSGPELLRQGAQMMDNIRGQNRVWRSGHGHHRGRGRGRGHDGGPGAKKRKFMKPQE